MARAPTGELSTLILTAWLLFVKFDLPVVTEKFLALRRKFVSGLQGKAVLAPMDNIFIKCRPAFEPGHPHNLGNGIFSLGE